MSAAISISPSWTRLNGSRLVSLTCAASDWRARISVWKRGWVCGLKKMSTRTTSDPKARRRGLLRSTALVGAIVSASIVALAYNSKSITDTRGELGLRADKSFALHDGVLTLRGRAAWAHDFNPDRSVGATFQTLPGASFVVNGAAQASDSALVTGAAEMKWPSGWSTAATLEGEFSNVTRSYAGKGVARYQW
jgi:hypothetical protein